MRKNNFQFIPEDIPIFSEFGCKQVADKVELIRSKYVLKNYFNAKNNYLFSPGMENDCGVPKAIKDPSEFLNKGQGRKIEYIWTSADDKGEENFSTKTQNADAGSNEQPYQFNTILSLKVKIIQINKMNPKLIQEKSRKSKKSRKSRKSKNSRKPRKLCRSGS